MKDDIHCEEHGNIRVRGIAYPVTTYRVIDLKANLALADAAITPSERALIKGGACAGQKDAD